MKEVRIPAHAKVNLRLEVLGKRADGYHELRTIFQTVSLHDKLRLRSSRQPGITLSVTGNETLSQEPLEKNLVYRAVDALRRELKVRAGVEILLEKEDSGWERPGWRVQRCGRGVAGLPATDRKEDERGATDVDRRRAGSRCAVLPVWRTSTGSEQGDEIYPLPDIPKVSLLIVSSKDIHVPTPDAYRWLHAPELASLTKSAAAHKLYGFCALCWSAQEESLSNDFEAAVFRRHPRLGKIKRALLRVGASEALLAGSGSAVFGVFPSPAKARRAVVGFPQDQTFVCESISRARYARLVKNAIVG